MLGIHGLQPARFKSQEEQIALCKISINRYQEDLNKYLYLIDLQVSNTQDHIYLENNISNQFYFHDSN